MFLKHAPELNAFTSQASDESVSPSQTLQTLRSGCRYDLCAPRNTPAAPLLFGLSAGVQRSSTLRSLGLRFLPTGTNGGTRRLRNNCYLKSEVGGGDKRLNHMYNCSEVVAVRPEHEKYGSCFSLSAPVRNTVLQPELIQTILDDLFTNSRGKL